MSSFHFPQDGTAGHINVISQSIRNGVPLSCPQPRNIPPCLNFSKRFVIDPISNSAAGEVIVEFMNISRFHFHFLEAIEAIAIFPFLLQLMASGRCLTCPVVLAINQVIG